MVHLNIVFCLIHILSFVVKTSLIHFLSAQDINQMLKIILKKTWLNGSLQYFIIDFIEEMEIQTKASSICSTLIF